MAATSTGAGGGGLDLATATRDELVAHVHLQRALIRALHDKIVELEAGGGSASGGAAPAAAPASGAASSGTVTPTPGGGGSAPWPGNVPSHGQLSPAATSSPAAAEEAVLSPKTRTSLAQELANIRATLRDSDQSDLPQATRQQLLHAEGQIAGMLERSSSSTAVAATAPALAGGSQRGHGPAALGSHLIDMRRNPHHFGPRGAVTTGSGGSQQHAPTHAASPVQHAADAFRDDRIAAALHVQQQGLAAQYRPPGAANASPQSGASKLAAWRRGRATTPVRRPVGDHAADSSSASRVLDAHMAAAAAPADGLTASEPKRQAATPSRRGMAPPLMGTSADGMSPRVMSPAVLQERVRSRVDAMAEHYGAVPEPQQRRVVSPASARRLRR